MCKNIRASDYQMERSEGQSSEEKSSNLNEPEVKRPEWKNIRPAHERLWIWQRAHKLHLEICKICQTLPGHERYRLRQQIEGSSKSVEDNIAEGNESYYYNDKIKGFTIARKESGETQNHLRDMGDKKYLPFSKAQEMIDEYEEIKRGINGMIKRISEKKDIFGKKGSRKF